MAEVDQIFDAFSKLSNAAHLADARRRKLDQIRSVEKRECGNCEKWMTRDCIPESERGQFKSASSTACHGFVISASRERLAAEFRRQLELLA